MAGGATAVFNPKTLAEWLAANNQSPKNYELAVENFTLSLAGYCVATYGLDPFLLLLFLPFYCQARS